MQFLTIIGISVAVATLLVTIGIVNGFGSTYRRSLLDFNAHIVLMRTSEFSDEQLRAVDEQIDALRGTGAVTATSPFLYREGLLIGGGKIRGVILKGIDVNKWRQVNKVKLNIQGNLADVIQVPSVSFRRKPESIDPDFRREESIIPIVVGEGIPIANKIQLFLPVKKGKEQMLPVRIVGTFSSGLYDYDSQFVLVGLPVLQKIFGAVGKTTGVEIRLSDPDAAASVSKSLMEKLPYDVSVIPWTEMHRPILEAVSLERLLLGIIMGLIVCVAAFNILATTLIGMLKSHRTIAIYRTIGLSARRTCFRYFLSGLKVGAVGVLSGLVIGGAIAVSIARFKWVEIPAEIYFLSRVPIDLGIRTVAAIAVFGLAVCASAAAYSARKVTRLPILDILGRQYR